MIELRKKCFLFASNFARERSETARKTAKTKKEKFCRRCRDSRRIRLACGDGKSSSNLQLEPQRAGSVDYIIYLTTLYVDCN